MTGRNPWGVLRVAENATYDEVHRAFRRRVKETHPDGGGDVIEFEAVMDAFDAIRRIFFRQGRAFPGTPTPYDRWLEPSCSVGSAPSGDRRTGAAPRRSAGTWATLTNRPSGTDFMTMLLGEMSKTRGATARG